MDANEALQAIAAIATEIEDVAAKTKLLGFNAAIVAAQAGEHGKAFLVVAEQMKALNQRTTAAAASLQRANVELRTSLQQGARERSPSER